MPKLDVNKLFSTHVPNVAQANAMKTVRDYAAVFAGIIQEYVPEGPNQTLAIRHVEDALMRANKGIVEGE